MPEIKNFKYTNLETGAEGFLSLHGLNHSLSAGGLRIQKGLTAEKIEHLSRLMTLKQEFLGLSVNGAKCGLNMDPAHPDAEEELRNFIDFLRPFLEDRFSMGGDLNVSYRQIDDKARELGISSIKHAIARAQGFSEQEFLRRINTLQTQVGPLTLGQRRAGHAVAHITAATLDKMGIPKSRASVGIQGFGTIGRAAARGLQEASIPVNAVADLGGMLSSKDGLDLSSLVNRPLGKPVGNKKLKGAKNSAGNALFSYPLDILILGATEDSVPKEAIEQLEVPCVMVAANLGLCDKAMTKLEEKNTIVIPDFVGGSGGSASMEALFGPEETPEAQQVLDTVAWMMQALVDKTFRQAQNNELTFREAAHAICEQNREMVSQQKPYGAWRTEAVTV
jgi:glutamate dehydrogenase/leucine dehydrogenase